MPNIKNKIIFVVGFPRSGTTWFSNLINAHPEVIYRHEIIGRSYDIFGEKLFNDLKFNNGLSQEQQATFMKKLAIANVETDKPPFFNKSVLRVANNNTHKIGWLATKSLPFLNGLYRYLFSPNKKKDAIFLIKETRSTINLDSILAGVAPSAILFLFRQPYGAIASHIKGIKARTMGEGNKENIQKWVEWHSERSYVQKLINEGFNFDGVSDVELFAIKWRVYNDDLLVLKETFNNSLYCYYDQFVDSPIELTSKLFQKINLEFSSSVKEFILDSSNKNKQQNILQKDASNDFFSVYRSSYFNKDQWKDILSTDDIAIIDKHTKETFESLIKASQ